MNHYITLGVDKKATVDEIKKAYRKLASQHHPDKGGDTAKFQEIQTAYDTLSDPEKRAAHDNPSPFGTRTDGGWNGWKNAGVPPGFEDLFAQFGFGDFDAPRQQQRRNKNISGEITISLSDTLEHQTKTLSILTSNNNRTNVDIKIPRGITSGTSVKYPSLGDTMFGNLPPGDLIITVNVLANQNYQVSGLDLIVGLTIDCFQAILGSEQTIVGLDNKQFTIQTPVACQQGTKLKIMGEGLWGFQNDIKGHLFVNVSISIPKNLTDDQKNLIQSLVNQR